VVELFRRLKDAGAIQDWTVVHPPRDGIEFRGGIWAWPFMPGTKRKRSWCNLDGNQERRRSALVCEVELDGAKMYWLEIETRANEKKEAFKALLFGIGERDRTVTIEKLLRIAAARKGVWPECEILEKAVTAPVRKWQHRFEKAPTMQLVAKSAMKALYEIVVLAAVSKSDSE